MKLNVHDLHDGCEFSIDMKQVEDVTYYETPSRKGTRLVVKPEFREHPGLTEVWLVQETPNELLKQLNDAI